MGKSRLPAGPRAFVVLLVLLAGVLTGCGGSSPANPAASAGSGDLVSGNGMFLTSGFGCGPAASESLAQ